MVISANGLGRPSDNDLLDLEKALQQGCVDSTEIDDVQKDLI